MKIFSWVANKIGAKQDSRRSANSTAQYRTKLPECRNDEFSDWPQSLLAIGTFGNRQIEEVAQSSSWNAQQTMQDSVKFTEVEVDNIRKEFEVLLQGDDDLAEGDDDEQVSPQKHGGQEADNEKRREQLINKEIILISKAKEMVGKKGSKLKPRSVASLFRFLVCKGGFAATVPEPRNTLPQSRMEKLLRAILQKKIHPQSSSTRRPLDWKLDEREINECLEDALRDLDDDGAKWDKTDSDFIVLEM